MQRSSRCFAEPGPYQSPAFETAPALQRTASQELRAALRPGHESGKIAVHELVNVYLSPSFNPRLSCACPVQRGGASRGVTEVGQSESWPEGQPEGRCGARGRASQARTREALGSRPGPLRGSAFNGWTGQVKGGVTCLDGELARACARKLGPRGRNRCDGASERRFCYYQGASFGAPSPLKVDYQIHTSGRARLAPYLMARKSARPMRMTLGPGLP